MTNNLHERPSMRRVILESPYAGKTSEEIAANVDYARAAVRDCVLRGESAYASHLLFTQPGILRDNDQSERAIGMRAGMSWSAVAEAVVAYTDRGISPGMKAGLTRAHKLGLPIEYRTLLPTRLQPALSPAALHDLLMTIGFDIDPRVLASAAHSDDDIHRAEAWAKNAHDIAQGIDVPGPSPICPQWLGEILDLFPDTLPGVP